MVPNIGALAKASRPARAAAFVTSLMAAMLLVSWSQTGGYAQSDGIFLETEQRGVTPTAPLSNGITTTRARVVGIEFHRLATARADLGRPGAPAPTLTLNLFDDVTLVAVIEQSARTASGYSLAGRIDGTELLGTLTLVVNGEVVAGTVQTLRATYTIRTTSTGQHVIREVDTSALPPEAEPLLPPETPPPSDRIQPVAPPSARPPRATADQAGGDDGSQIDVLVFYTAAARRAEGGNRAIQALIDLMVAETNHAYARSGVIQRVALVGVKEVDYVERSVEGALDHLIGRTDGQMDEAHALRDDRAADLVHLILDRGDEDLCGQAVLGGLVGRFDETDAFGVTGYDCGAATFAHELGHNMGLIHDRYRVIFDKGDPSALPNPYHYGYVNQRAFDGGASKSRRWRTIMAYNTQCDDAGFYCKRLLYFGNPDNVYNGDRMGVYGSTRSSSVTGPADARRHLNDTRVAIANYRIGTCPLGDLSARVSLQADSGHYLVAEGNGGGAVNANRRSVGAWETFIVRGEGQERCLQSGDVVSIRTTDGFHFRAEGGGGSTLDATATGAGLWEQFAVRRAAGHGAIRSRDLIGFQTPTGHYISADEGGGSSVNANRTRLGPWETFAISVLGFELPPLPPSTTETFAFTLPASYLYSLAVGPVLAGSGPLTVALDYEGSFTILACIGTGTPESPGSCIPMSKGSRTFNIPTDFQVGAIRALVYFHPERKQPSGDARGTVSVTYTPQ